MNPSTAVIAELLTACRTIAVVGLSPNPDRPSHEVAQHLQRHGYRIVPVNPAFAGQRILNEDCHASLTEARDALAASGVKIDMVDCFRRAEFIDALADEAIAIEARCLWMQMGIVNEKAAAKARAAGLVVVMNRCTKVDHAILLSQRSA